MNLHYDVEIITPLYLICTPRLNKIYNLADQLIPQVILPRVFV